MKLHSGQPLGCHSRAPTGTAIVVGPGRNWTNLWKPTIDALDPLLDRTRPDRDWHPLDGRITELALHVHVDLALQHDVVASIIAAPARTETIGP